MLQKEGDFHAVQAEEEEVLRREPALVLEALFAVPLGEDSSTQLAHSIDFSERIFRRELTNRLVTRSSYDVRQTS